MDNHLIAGGTAVAYICRRLPIPINKTTIYRMLASLDIVCLKIGGRFFVPADSIRSFLDPFVTRPGPWISLRNAHRIFNARIPGMEITSKTFWRYLVARERDLPGTVVRLRHRIYVSRPDLERIIEDERALLREKGRRRFPSLRARAARARAAA